MDVRRLRIGPETAFRLTIYFFISSDFEVFLGKKKYFKDPTHALKKCRYWPIFSGFWIAQIMLRNFSYQKFFRWGSNFLKILHLKFLRILRRLWNLVVYFIFLMFIWMEKSIELSNGGYYTLWAVLGLLLKFCYFPNLRDPPPVLTFVGWVLSIHR